jgi:hypothetical protein
VIIGGSDEYHALNLCELYYHKTDTLYTFPSLKIARENSSVCVLDNYDLNGDLNIYMFGGFDK